MPTEEGIIALAKIGSTRYGCAMTPLDLSISEVDGHLIITMRGDLDIASHERVDAYLRQVLAEHVGETVRVVVDMSGVTFMDTTGLTVLLKAWRELERTGGSLVLAGPIYRQTRVLWTTGLAGRLRITDSVEAAVEAPPA
jgi:anti-sigma B factor antagonist